MDTGGAGPFGGEQLLVSQYELATVVWAPDSPWHTLRDRELFSADGTVLGRPAEGRFCLVKAVSDSRLGARKLALAPIDQYWQTMLDVAGFRSSSDSNEQLQLSSSRTFTGPDGEQRRLSIPADKYGTLYENLFPPYLRADLDATVFVRDRAGAVAFGKCTLQSAFASTFGSVLWDEEASDARHCLVQKKGTEKKKQNCARWLVRNVLCLLAQSRPDTHTVLTLIARRRTSVASRRRAASAETTCAGVAARAMRLC